METGSGSRWPGARLFLLGLSLAALLGIWAVGVAAAPPRVAPGLGDGLRLPLPPAGLVAEPLLTPSPAPTSAPTALVELVFLHSDSHVDRDANDDGILDVLPQDLRVIEHTLALAEQLERFPKHYVHTGDFIHIFAPATFASWALFLNTYDAITDSPLFLSKTLTRGNHDIWFAGYPFHPERMVDLQTGARLASYDYGTTRLTGEDRPDRLSLEDMVRGFGAGGETLLVACHDPIIDPWGKSEQSAMRRNQVRSLVGERNVVFLAGHYHHPVLGYSVNRDGRVTQQVVSEGDLKGLSYWVVTIDPSTKPYANNAHYVLLEQPAQVFVTQPQFSGLIPAGEDGQARAMVRAIITGSSTRTLTVRVDGVFVGSIPCEGGLCEGEISFAAFAPGEHRLSVLNPMTGRHEDLPLFIKQVPTQYENLLRWWPVK